MIPEFLPLGAGNFWKSPKNLSKRKRLGRDWRRLFRNGSGDFGARMGCKVALIQDRRFSEATDPVRSGSGQRETSAGEKYPRIGEIIEEISDKAKKSPGTYEEFEDAKKETIVRAEKNIDLQLYHHAFKVEKSGNKISAVQAFDASSGSSHPFSPAPFSWTRLDTEPSVFLAEPIIP